MVLMLQIRSLLLRALFLIPVFVVLNFLRGPDATAQEVENNSPEISSDPEQPLTAQQRATIFEELERLQKMFGNGGAEKPALKRIEGQRRIVDLSHQLGDRTAWEHEIKLLRRLLETRYGRQKAFHRTLEPFINAVDNHVEPPAVNFDVKIKELNLMWPDAPYSVLVAFWRAEFLWSRGRGFTDLASRAKMLSLFTLVSRSEEIPQSVRVAALARLLSMALINKEFQNVEELLNELSAHSLISNQPDFPRIREQLSIVVSAHRQRKTYKGK